MGINRRNFIKGLVGIAAAAVAFPAAAFCAPDKRVLITSSKGGVGYMPVRSGHIGRIDGFKFYESKVPQIWADEAARELELARRIDNNLPIFDIMQQPYWGKWGKSVMTANEIPAIQRESDARWRYLISKS